MNNYPPDWPEIARRVKEGAGECCEICGAPNGPAPHMLTVHHLDFNKANCSDENLMAMCQRCHLKCQGMKVPPRTREEALRRMKSQGQQLSLLARFPGHFDEKGLKFT